MTFLIWLLIIVVAVIVVLLIRKYTSLELVAHAKLLFKAWSVWLGTAGAALSASAALLPDSFLSAWNILPPDIKAILPQNLQSVIGSTLMAAAVISQFVRQKKLLGRKQEMENGNELHH